MDNYELLRASDGGGRAVLAHITANRLVGATVIQVDDLDNWPDEFIVTTGTLAANGYIDSSTVLEFAAHKDAGTIVIDDIEPGFTDVGNTAGQVAIVKQTTGFANRATDYLTNLRASLDARAPGFLGNGKIVTSVTGNNLKVEIKTLDDADPSPADPVIVRIGNVVHKITAALSVTKNAGTNWFNSGATETATFEIDYFVYLGYNATDGVVLGFSRLPNANTYGDFSAVTTNDKYAAISTIANADATDGYTVIGRFNAILSATPSFNWSIPATSIIIQRPIYETRILSFIPVLSGRFTDAKWNKTGFYTIVGGRVYLRLKLTANAATPMAGGSPDARWSLPVKAKDYAPAENSFKIGQGAIYDVGTTLFDCAPILFASSPTDTGIFRTGTSGIGSIDSTTPMTWASGDEITITANYDRA